MIKRFVLRDGMSCPYCEKGELKMKSVMYRGEYKGKVFETPTFHFHCYTCNETIIDPNREKEAEKEFMKWIENNK